MTTEQIALVKRLIKKYGINESDGEWTLIFLGVGYGLSEKQIETYLALETSDLLQKHERMLCIILGKKPESNTELLAIRNPAERLRHLFKEPIHDDGKKQYEMVMQYIIKDEKLSAAQIEQLRQAVEAKMPEDAILEMAKNHKDVMEIRRCIEFYQMTNKKEKTRREGRRESR